MLGEVHRLRDLQLPLVVQVGRRLLQPVGARPMSTSGNWITMPLAGGATPAQDRPSHPVEGNAVLVYRGAQVFVAVDDAALAGLERYPDVRRLTRAESAELEATLPGGGLPPARENPPLVGKRGTELGGRLGLGDLVASVTRRLGVPECAGCSERRRRLNRVPLWRTAGASSGVRPAQSAADPGNR
jgi:hypothetical protein